MRHDVHPPWEALLGEPGPEARAHLEVCPRCRIDARMLAEVEAADPADLDGIAEARASLRAVSERSLASFDSFLRLEEGRKVERYTVEARLGSGGMGSVYRVRHDLLGASQALKVLHRTSATERERLFREGRAQSRLRHPNVVAVTDVVDVDGVPGLILEYVDGPTLAQHLARKGPLPAREADRLAIGILRGVAAAHREGLVHRDLKPSNVLLAPGDEGLLPKVADFGLVRSMQDDTTRLTKSGSPMGTPSYMSPEQIRDASTADPRSDVFSLGALLFELVTGRQAFPGTDWLEICDRIRAGSYVAPEVLVPDLPPRVARTISRCLQPDPDARFPDAAAVLEAWLPPAAPTPPAAPRPRALPWVLSLTLLALPALLAVVGTLGAAAGWFAKDRVGRTVERVSDDPAVQGEFERGWEAFFEAEFEDAAARFQRVAAHERDAVLPLVLLGASHDLDRDPSLAMLALDRAVERARDRDGRDAELARLYNRDLYFPGSSDGWGRLLDDHPRDPLVWILAARSPAWTPEEASTLARRLLDDAPRAASRAAAVDLLMRRELVHAFAVPDTDRATHTDVVLDFAAGTGEEPYGTIVTDHDVAVLTDHPEDHELRYHVANHLGLARGEAAREEQLAIVFSAGTPIADRLRLLKLDARYELGRGRPTRARDRLDQCERDAEIADRAVDVVLCNDLRVRLALLRGDAGELSAAMLALWQTALDEEVPDELRRRVLSAQIYLEGRRALLDGHYRSAWQAAERIRALPDPYVWWLTRQDAAADLSQRAAPATAPESRLPGASAHQLAPRAGACRARFARGRIARAQGEPVLAREAFFEVVAGDERCAPIFEERYLLAAARVHLAETAQSRVGALRHVEALRRLWPDAEPDHPLLLRAERVVDPDEVSDAPPHPAPG